MALLCICWVIYNPKVAIIFKDDQLELAPTRCHVCWKLTSPASPSGGVVVGDPFLGFDGSQARCPRHPRSCGGLWPGSSRAGLSGTIL